MQELHVSRELHIRRVFDYLGPELSSTHVRISEVSSAVCSILFSLHNNSSFSKNSIRKFHVPRTNFMINWLTEEECSLIAYLQLINKREGWAMRWCSLRMYLTFCYQHRQRVYKIQIFILINTFLKRKTRRARKYVFSSVFISFRLFFLLPLILLPLWRETNDTKISNISLSVWIVVGQKIKKMTTNTEEKNCEAAYLIDINMICCWHNWIIW